jgi:hypothetical protein
MVTAARVKTDYATLFQLELKETEAPDTVICEYIRSIDDRRKRGKLTEEEAQGICQTAMDLFIYTDNPLIQKHCLLLVAATRSPVAIEALEVCGLRFATTQSVENVLCRIMTETLYQQ